VHNVNEKQVPALALLLAGPDLSLPSMIAVTSIMGIKILLLTVVLLSSYQRLPE